MSVISIKNDQKKANEKSQLTDSKYNNNTKNYQPKNSSKTDGVKENLPSAILVLSENAQIKVTQESISSTEKVNTARIKQKYVKEQENNQYIMDYLKNAQYKLDNFKKMLEKKQSNLSYNPVNDLSKLSGLTNVRQVYSLKNRVRTRYYQIAGSGGDPKIVNQLLGQIRKVIGKIDTKIASLNYEDEMEAKCRKAELLRNKKEEKQMREELRRKQKARKLREQDDILNAKKRAEIESNFDSSQTSATGSTLNSIIPTIHITDQTPSPINSTNKDFSVSELSPSSGVSIDTSIDVTL